MTYATWELHPGDAGYPELLQQTPDPPKTIYGCGDPGALRPGLAVIGARKATPYGITCASRFAGWAAQHGICIVSGAAIGCDMAAHDAALSHDGSTVAVLGCGADVDYPHRAAALLATLRSHHAVISEVPWGTPPQRWAFSERNRIIAGLARAVLVVEAGLPSGTFGTADHALAAGRDVLAVPGSILSPECQGSNRLISQGCTPITSESELREALFMAGLNLIDDPDAPAGNASTRENDPLMRALTVSPMRPDDIAFHMKRDIVSIAHHLAQLELRGWIQRLADGRYSITVERPAQLQSTQTISAQEKNVFNNPPRDDHRRRSRR